MCRISGYRWTTTVRKTSSARAVGRKNWLFAGSPQASQRAAAIMHELLPYPENHFGCGKDNLLCSGRKVSSPDVYCITIEKLIITVLIS
jgi:hypothetical protein